jgi:hemolysin activation/secretion protein
MLLKSRSTLCRHVPSGRAATLCALLLSASATLVYADEAATPAPTPTNKPATTAAAPAAPAAPMAAPAPVAHFDILEFDITGNTVLDEESIDTAVEPFLGEQRTADDVDHARAALEELYRSRGYKTVAVAIPRQNVREGVVQLTVTESHVGHLNVVGSQYHSIDTIKQDAPSMAEGSVPNFNNIQKDIVGLNQQPDRRVTPSLKAGQTPGTVDFDLVVDDHLPVHGSVELNNRRSQDTSELRTMGSLSYDNLWQAGHSFSLSYQTAPENQSDARVLFGSYLARFGASPFSLLVNGLKSDSNVATVGSTDVVGKGQSAGMRGIFSLPGDDGFYQSASFGVDYKHFRNFTTLGGQSLETPVTYYPFSFGYTAALHDSSSVTQGDATFTFASPKMGSTTADIDNNRAYARGEQFYVRANLSRQQDLPFGFQGYLHLGGQLTDQPLITNEQFSVGGADTVRGYLEAEALGDYGHNDTVELRSPQLADYLAFGKAHHPFDEFRFFGFWDSAQVRLHEPLPDQRSSFTLASAGAGLNVRLFYVNGTVLWADPIFDGPASPAWKGRVLFRVWSSF